jgi:predicted ATPase
MAGRNMQYLDEFRFTSIDQEEQFLNYVRATCYDTFYPFGILSARGLRSISFEPLTILYGGNGCGKTTVLNIIAEKLGAKRDTLYNRSSFYEDYLKMCSYEKGRGKPEEIRIITSDDVFDFMLNLRSLNEGLDEKRKELFEEYTDARYSKFRMRSLDDYEQLKKVVSARKKSSSQSKYVRENMMGNVREHSNGESAFLYFTEKIGQNSIYLLDEPENSLSPEKQMELSDYLENSVRFYGCQIIMATHSPFLLSMKGARIYDLDENPVDIKRWTQLPNVRVYYEFFKKHHTEF